jgi:positive regulator of sigma E activity
METLRRNSVLVYRGPLVFLFLAGVLARSVFLYSPRLTATQ